MSSSATLSQSETGSGTRTVSMSQAQTLSQSGSNSLSQVATVSGAPAFSRTTTSSPSVGGAQSTSVSLTLATGFAVCNRVAICNVSTKPNSEHHSVHSQLCIGRLHAFAGVVCRVRQAHRVSRLTLSQSSTASQTATSSLSAGQSAQHHSSHKQIVND